MFERLVTSQPVYTKNNSITHYKNRDGEILQIFSKVLNFTPVFVASEDGETFGHQFLNGTFTGALASIEYNKADLSANCRIITDYNTSNCLLLHPIAPLKLVFFLEKPGTKLEVVMTLFFLLDDISKSISIILMMSFPIILYVVQNIESKIKNRKRISFVRSVFFTFGLQNNIALKHPPLIVTRMVIASILFYTLVFTSVFQSTAIQNLSTGRVSGNIESLDDLYYSDYEIQVKPDLAAILGHTKFSDRFQLTLNPNKTSNRKFATIYGEDMAYDLLEKHQKYFQVLSETPFEFYDTMMIPKHSPFKDKFNEIISRIVEAGIVEYQYRLAINYSNKNFKNAGKKARKLDLSDLSSFFILYVQLNSLAVLVFLLEIVFSRLKRYKKGSRRIKRFRRWNFNRFR